MNGKSSAGSSGTQRQGILNNSVSYLQPLSAFSQGRERERKTEAETERENQYHTWLQVITISIKQILILIHLYGLSSNRREHGDKTDILLYLYY